MKNLTKVTVTLVQGDANVKFSKELPTIKADEIGGTISNAIIQFRKKVKKYKIKIDGFSFARKFEVIVSINNEIAESKDVFGDAQNNELNIKFATTMNNEQNFVMFIKEYVDTLLFKESETIVSNEEVIDQLIAEALECAN